MKFIVANWKMNCNLQEAKALVTETANSLQSTDYSGVKIILCPPFTALEAVRAVVGSQKAVVGLGAQNCHFMPCGAFTGEVSPKMPKDFCDYVILGHSERRKHFEETDALINRKIKAALEVGLKPIVCVGESQKGEKSDIILSQVKNAVKDIRNEDLSKIIIAYEPVWAISTSQDCENCEPSYAAKIIKEIKEELHAEIPVLYGGSITSSNISSFLGQEIIDGVLVGGASLKAKEFIKIIERAGAKDASKF